jgi:hypothetical protein
MAAYGENIDCPLAMAARRLFDRPGRIEQCIAAMQMNTPPALLRQRVEKLLPSRSASAA